MGREGAPQQAAPARSPFTAVLATTGVRSRARAPSATASSRAVGRLTVIQIVVVGGYLAEHALAHLATCVRRGGWCASRPRGGRGAWRRRLEARAGSTL